jgi:hypothetical protein
MSPPGMKMGVAQFDFEASQSGGGQAEYVCMAVICGVSVWLIVTGCLQLPWFTICMPVHGGGPLRVEELPFGPLVGGAAQAELPK